MPQVSVIVPVYNVAPYLRRCLDSFVGQTLRDIEIVCVDDGSTDGSGAILDEYAVRDVRLRVIHQANAGVGAARNAALPVASGEYVYFCDPDDYALPRLLERMVARAKEVSAEIVLGGRVAIGRFRRLPGRILPAAAVKRRHQPFPGRAFPVGLFELARTAVWDKLFRRDFVERLGLRFAPTLYAEDMVFVATALAAAERIASADCADYVHWSSRPDSLVHQKDRRPLDLFAAYDATIASFRAHGLLSAFEPALCVLFLMYGTRSLCQLSDGANRRQFYGVFRSRYGELRRHLGEAGEYSLPRWCRRVGRVLSDFEAPGPLLRLLAQERRGKRIVRILRTLACLELRDA